MEYTANLTMKALAALSWLGAGGKGETSRPATVITMVWARENGLVTKVKVARL